MGQMSSDSRRSSHSSNAPLNRPLGWRQPDETYITLVPGGTSIHPLTRSRVGDAWAEVPTDGGITRPAPPLNLRRVSELIDPWDLVSGWSDELDRWDPTSLTTPVMSYQAKPDINKSLPPLIESPSGHTIGAKEFLEHPRRPLAIRERQEGILRALEQAQLERRREEAERRQAPRRDDHWSKIGVSRTRYSRLDELNSVIKVSAEKKGCIQIPHHEELEQTSCFSCFK